MATIRKRQNKWQVQFRREGFPRLSKSFIKKADAQLWARHIEAKADGYELRSDPRQLANIKLSDLVERYQREIVPRKKGAAVEHVVLAAILRHKIVTNSLAVICTKHFAAYRGVSLGHGWLAMEQLTCRRNHEPKRLQLCLAR